MLNNIPYDKFISVKKYNLIKTHKVFGVTGKKHNTPLNLTYNKDIEEDVNIHDETNMNDVVLYDGGGNRVKFKSTSNNIITDT